MAVLVIFVRLVIQYFTLYPLLAHGIYIYIYTRYNFHFYSCMKNCIIINIYISITNLFFDLGN